MRVNLQHLAIKDGLQFLIYYFVLVHIAILLKMTMIEQTSIRRVSLHTTTIHVSCHTKTRNHHET